MSSFHSDESARVCTRRNSNSPKAPAASVNAGRGSLGGRGLPFQAVLIAGRIFTRGTGRCNDRRSRALIFMRKSAALIVMPIFAACAASFPGRAWDIRRGIEYSREGGAVLRADAWIPDGVGPHPAVLLVHGGGWARGKREDMDGIAKRLVRRGFVVVNVSYRLAPEHLYPAPVADLRQALAWMKTNALELKIDPARCRVGLFGRRAPRRTSRVRVRRRGAAQGRGPGGYARRPAPLPGGPPRRGVSGKENEG
jgi:hypothetical protein